MFCQRSRKVYLYTFKGRERGEEKIEDWGETNEMTRSPNGFRGTGRLA